MNKNIAIIGGGNLGRAIAVGLKNAGYLESIKIFLTRRNIDHLSDLQGSGITVTSDNNQAVTESEIIILAVQPKQLVDVISDLKPSLDPDRQVLVSVVTGVSIAEIEHVAGKEFSVIRAMPNTAIAMQESMTCIATNSNKKGVEEVQKIFDELGSTLIIEEQMMQAATVLGACGIAFFLRFIRAASQGGIEVGFHAEEAQLIAAQTARGASSLLLNSDDHPEKAIDKVTTPQGCTIAGLNEMEHHGLSSALIKGIVTSYKKIENIKQSIPNPSIIED